MERREGQATQALRAETDSGCPRIMVNLWCDAVIIRWSYRKEGMAGTKRGRKRKEMYKGRGVDWRSWSYFLPKLTRHPLGSSTPVTSIDYE